ncbi:hypothetical protein EJ04DRAFT_514746 [Polyplosphaeria fusca]|uniref:Uncharacterized protein n=1 Tax=Polyplosphaeria fusca TaxID=682080 RepID=A0A9P4QTV7_9PLEO|nr:hypothetical protein EJ04DRAFT_514746 [Polyplosphaeria fusca]
MSLLHPGLRLPLLLTTPLLLLPLAPLLHRRRPILCDSPDPLAKITSDLTSRYRGSNARTPDTRRSSAGGKARVVRQMSLGSVLGVLGGLGVSVFSKPLAVLIGLGIVVVQFIEARGIQVIPYSYFQRRFHSIDVQSLMLDNMAFKFSLGITFALATFAEF